MRVTVSHYQYCFQKFFYCLKANCVKKIGSIQNAEIEPILYPLFSVVYSVLSCIIGLLFGLQNGAYLFEVLDQVIYPIPSMFIATAEVFAIAWIYSIYRYLYATVQNRDWFLSDMRYHRYERD